MSEKGEGHGKVPRFIWVMWALMLVALALYAAWWLTRPPAPR